MKSILMMFLYLLMFVSFCFILLKVFIRSIISFESGIYSRLSLSRSQRDPLKNFEISVLRHNYQIRKIEENTTRTTKFLK